MNYQIACNFQYFQRLLSHKRTDHFQTSITRNFIFITYTPIDAFFWIFFGFLDFLNFFSLGMLSDGFGDGGGDGGDGGGDF